MARDQFQWEHLPIRLIRAIAQDAGMRGSSAVDLAELYGTPPSEEFVQENWEVLRDEWLPDADDARRSLVGELWELGVGYADNFPNGHDAEMAFLRTCNNARRLREAVLTAFIRFGERAAGDHPAKQPQKKADNPPVTAMASTPKIDIYDIADRLWETADELRANSHLKAAEYSIPVLGLIFLKFADSRFTQAEAELAGTATGRREIGKANYQARGVLYLPEQSRFAKLLRPEGGRQPRQGHQRRDGRDRGGEPSPEGRPASDVPVAHQRHPGQPAALGERHSGRHRGRRVRQGLRVLPRQVRRSPRVPRAGSTSRRHRSSG